MDKKFVMGVEGVDGLPFKNCLYLKSKMEILKYITEIIIGDGY